MAKPMIIIAQVAGSGTATLIASSPTVASPGRALPLNVRVSLVLPATKLLVKGLKAVLVGENEVVESGAELARLRVNGFPTVLLLGVI